VHKIPNTSVNSSKTFTQAYNTNLEKRTRHPIGLVSTGKGKFLKETSSKPCKWVMWSREVQASECNEGQGCKKCYLWVPLLEGELYMSWMHSFQAHSCLLFLFFSFFYILLLFLFLVQELIKGHYPGVVTSGGSVTHKYFHRNEKVGS
jgi:hypothetical protein